MVQWYNEGWAVRDAKMLAYAKQQVVELDSIAEIDPENDGKLVHIYRTRYDWWRVGRS